MAHFRFILFVILASWSVSWAQNAGDTLVLVDNLAIKETHSIFFKSLQGKKNLYFFVVLQAKKKKCRHNVDRYE